MKDLLQELHGLYAEVDREARRLETIHDARLQCGRGCSDCCVDELTVFEVEAESIRQHHSALLMNGSPHPEGKCAFLDADGACRIYDHRPYVCRTQGLPLRWIEEETELRDICPLNEEGSPIEELSAKDCWEIGPFEARLAKLQAREDGGELRRVPLRSLFLAKIGGDINAG